MQVYHIFFPSCFLASSPPFYLFFLNNCFGYTYLQHELTFIFNRLIVPFSVALTDSLNSLVISFCSIDRSTSGGYFSTVRSLFRRLDPLSPLSMMFVLDWNQLEFIGTLGILGDRNRTSWIGFLLKLARKFVGIGLESGYLVKSPSKVLKFCQNISKKKKSAEVLFLFLSEISWNLGK